MYYVIQEGMFREEGHRSLVELLQRHGFEYEEILFRPFVEGLDLKTDRQDVFVFGSVNLSKKFGKYKLNPGTLDNENHDFEVYASYYKDHMLNYDGVVIKFGDPLPEGYEYFFARPTKDTKSFSGQLFSREKWEQWQKDLDDSNLKQRMSAETKVLVAPLKQTQKEVRCWIVDGKVVTMSLYKQYDRPYQENYDGDACPSGKRFAQQMADIFCPAKAFCLDICLVGSEMGPVWKVVEINCINSSGFYKGDMSKLLQALEEAFSPSIYDNAVMINGF
jgi:hypothetical protein